MLYKGAFCSLKSRRRGTRTIRRKRITLDFSDKSRRPGPRDLRKKLCVRNYFVSGRAAKSWDEFNTDWGPALLLGNKKGTDRADHKEAAANGSERARKRELEKKPPFEKRQLERGVKRQKCNETG